MKLFRRLFGISDEKRCAYDLYGKAVSRARLPVFYQRLAVSDTLDGRFDMVVLHVYLLLRRLRTIPRSEEIQSCLQEALFADMDRNLREMGVGDLSVGKRVRQMAEAFAGRVRAYDAALNLERSQEDGKALAAAIARNVYRGRAAGGQAPQRLAHDIRAQIRKLNGAADGDILAGTVDFAPFEYDQQEPTNGQRFSTFDPAG